MNGLQLYAKDLLMGTTYAGGASGAGVLFTMSLDGKESVLHNFCSGNNCTGGQAPNGDLLKFNGNHIVGTTTAGGTTNFDGVAYSVTQ